MINLVVDIGNSNIKYFVWNGNEVLFQESVLSLDPEYLKKVIDHFNVESVITANVGKEDKSLGKATTSIPSESKLELTIKNAKNYQINYSETLGADRIAAFIGAVETFPNTPLLIIDAGTALTIDIVNIEGEFCGGNISLGLNSRLKALHKLTARLPLVKIKEPKSFFGQDTDSAILNGVVNGMIGEINYSISKAKELYNVEKIILTGGESTFLIQEFKKQGIDFFYDPFLVARGLNFFMQRKMKDREYQTTMKS